MAQKRPAQTSEMSEDRGQRTKYSKDKVAPCRWRIIMDHMALPPLMVSSPSEEKKTGGKGSFPNNYLPKIQKRINLP